jgi:class 3 adenylate cyclase
MVCSLITLAPASADHDVEDDVDLVTGFHRIVADLAARFGGIVAQYRGKAVALHFGYPTAHEYDAERAVSAGLALVNSIEKLASSDVKIQASVGIATGLVVVGEKPATDNRWH